MSQVTDQWAGGTVVGVAEILVVVVVEAVVLDGKITSPSSLANNTRSSLVMVGFLFQSVGMLVLTTHHMVDLVLCELSGVQIDYSQDLILQMYLKLIFKLLTHYKCNNH
jgi:hypothetical protein